MGERLNQGTVLAAKPIEDPPMAASHARFTVRGMMISVAVVGSLLSVPSCLVRWTDTTYYAKGYSDQKFLSIPHGMQESDVIRILGEPLKVGR
jgi:hypothetical protein